MCLITRGAGIPTVINVDGLDSDRSKWPRARQGLPALRRAQRAALGRHARSPTPTPSPRSSSAATASASASCPTASRTPGHDGTRDARAPRPRAAQATSCSSAAWSPRTTRTCSSRRSRASRRERARGHEARRRRRRALRRRVHPPGHAPHGRPARDLPRLRLRRAATGSSSATPTLFCAPDRGRRHAPGDPRGAGRRQLRARQRPRAERRDGRRRRPDFSGREGVPALTAQLERLLDDPELVEQLPRAAPASAPSATRGTR